MRRECSLKHRWKEANWSSISFSKGLIAAGRNISTEIDYDSPRELFFGHGTHTSSTAAGNYAAGVSHFEYAKGNAAGLAPRAHGAIYKVLFATDTLESAASDVLAGLRKGLLVYVPTERKGLLVYVPTGNDGDFNSTHNGAPWITTVGAGTLDPSITATMTLENGLIVKVTSYFQKSVHITNASSCYGRVMKAKHIATTTQYFQVRSMER
ncbi:hypothetical protein GH714_005159 [Hevea brasiliensis]|uniref:Peptidase S8/S53 domain-containing protein n=1 Tax=Hevea brasiliensis TaxID=3981 RepID=A0A6A6M975_HEVBR|nr:hypothetical protein GH714_005159 [Hevea brasiliensis]